MSLLTLVLLACLSADTQPVKSIVFVSILPQKFFVERVAGEFVETHVLVGPGQSHHTYEPTPRQIQELSLAQVYFAIGVPFERSVLERLRSAMPNLQVVDTTTSVTFRRAEEECEEGDHHSAEEHERDPHIWLDPKIAKILSRNICNTLCLLDPAHAPDFRRNLQALERDLDVVDSRIANELAPFRGKQFFVFHPAYGYFGDAFGLKQAAVEEGGKEPSLKRLYQLVRRAREQHVKVILVQPQFPQAGARAVADAIGGVVAPVDPLAPDYLENLTRLSHEIARGLSKQDAASTQTAASN